MTPCQPVYDPKTDQLVLRVPAAGGEGDVEPLRLDVKDRLGRLTPVEFETLLQTAHAA